MLAAKEYPECLGKVFVSEELMGIRWMKLLMNATFIGLSTAPGTTFGGVLDNHEAMKLILRAGKECPDVAAYNGVTLAPYEEYDFYNTFRLENHKNNELSIRMISEIWQQHYNLTASMAQDILRGKEN